MTIYISEQDAQRAGLVKGKKKAKAKDARPDIPRAASGEGDRIEQLTRIAVWGFMPRFDAGHGLFSFWNPRTGARIAAHEDYAQACAMAEKELRER